MECHVCDPLVTRQDSPPRTPGARAPSAGTPTRHTLAMARVIKKLRRGVSCYGSRVYLGGEGRCL